MNELPDNPTLKDINAFKKKLNWGDIPAIFHLAQSSISELDGVLTHGFDNAYKRLLNKNHWNLELLGGYHDEQGNIQVKRKPKITLKHVYDEQNYELHCFPIVRGERLHGNLLGDPSCPFENWTAESMRMLFRINSIISFLLFSFKNGDAADMALIKYAHIHVMKLIDVLSESFEIVDIIGYNIAEFYQEINRRSHLTDMSDMYTNSNEHLE